jgi:acetyl esterase/lipase
LNLAKNFTKLAPAIIFTAELDPLRDEGIVYYNKMKSAGNDITHIEFLGVPHAFTHLDAILDASKQYNQHVIDSLKRYIRK